MIRLVVAFIAAAASFSFAWTAETKGERLAWSCAGVWALAAGVSA